MDARVRPGHDDVFVLTHTFAFPRRDASGLCKKLSPQKAEGAGNAGRLVRPQRRVRG
jgi:hypothetical protein